MTPDSISHSSNTVTPDFTSHSSNIMTPDSTLNSFKMRHKCDIKWIINIKEKGPWVY